MQALVIKSNWQKQLRESPAAERLRCRQLDQFPLAQLQKLTDDFLKTSSSRWSWARTRRMIVPFSHGCDQIFERELSDLRLKDDGYLGMAQAGVLACIHVLTTTTAIAQLRSLMPDFTRANPVIDEYFDEKVTLYLRCLIITHRARPTLYSLQEALASKQLLRIAVAGPKTNNFPTISLSKLFGTVGPDGGHSDVLPDDFIKAVLQRATFGTTLEKELGRLRAARRWYEAYGLVKCIRPLLHQENPYQRQRAIDLIKNFVPHYTVWAAWQPSRTRVELWKNRIPPEHWATLFPVFDLEGPDDSGHQRGARRHSPAYLTTGTPGLIRLSTNHSVLEQILKLLDLAASVGSECIDLLIYLCIETGPPTARTLNLLTSALEAAQGWNGDDSIFKVVKEYLANLDASPEVRLPSLAQAIAAMTRTPVLQATFGDSFDIKRTAVDILSKAQYKFCGSLEGSTPCETLGYGIFTLSRAMLDAAWLHSHWHCWYLTQLRQIPSHEEIAITFRELRIATAENNVSRREALVCHLGTKIGNRSRRNAQSVVLSDLDLLLLPQGPMWYDPLDLDRARFRDFIRTVPGITPALATACLERSREEDSTFIRALNGILLGCTDTVCVNLADFLGPRARMVRFHVDDCWKALLLHMMRQQPPGLPERAAALMDPAKLQAWGDNLRRLFGDQHLD